MDFFEREYLRAQLNGSANRVKYQIYLDISDAASSRKSSSLHSKTRCLANGTSHMTDTRSYGGHEKIPPPKLSGGGFSCKILLVVYSDIRLVPNFGLGAGGEDGLVADPQEEVTLFGHHERRYKWGESERKRDLQCMHPYDSIE